MEIKYEPVFGDQAKLNDQTNELAEVMLWHDFLGPKFVSLKELGEMNASGAIPSGSVILAMRRIIAEPKRWTVEDRRAGRLPEVGWAVTTYDTKRYVFVGESCHENQWSLRDAESGKVYHTPITWVLPIESPEEKAARLRSEWCNEAGLVCSLGMTTLTRIYDAMLSGELSTPSKDGE